jgi:hypothetical protein
MAFKFRSPLKRRSIAPFPVSLLLIPPAVLLAYITPAVAMSLPSPRIVSNTFQQWSVAAWNMFPLLVLTTHVLLSKFVEHFLAAGRKQPSHLSAVRAVSVTTLIMTFYSHAMVTRLSLATLAFPGIFANNLREALHPARLFLYLRFPYLRVSRQGTASTASFSGTRP